MPSRSFCSRLIGVVLAFVLCEAMPAQVKQENPITNPGFLHFYNNEFEEAADYFAAQTKLHPDDPDQYNHLAQAILYLEMFRDGALESQLVTGNNAFLRRPKVEITPEEKRRFDDSIAQSLKLSEAALQKNPHNELALYSLSVAHGLRANYLFLVEKAWIESLKETATARRTNEEIVRLDPSAVDAHLMLGLDEYIVGCLPFYLRAVGSMGGFHGDKQGGIRQLELVARDGVRNRYDAEVLLAAIYRREHCSSQAIPLLDDLAKTFPRNYLFRLEQVQMFSDMGNKNSALKVLNEIEELRSSGAPGYAKLPVEKIQYTRANLLFWYGDLEPALRDLKQVTQKADELDLNTAVLAWLRLGQVYDLQGDHRDAVNAYRETMKTAPKSEPANEAKAYISTPYRRKRTAG